MEVAVAKALKPSLQTELVFSQGIRDEILCLNANNVVVGEDFSVDDLFDFSNGKEIDDYDEEEEEEEEKSSSVSGSEQDRTEEDSNSNSTAAGDSDSIFAGELAVPADDVADLEWVSHFVDDSLPELSLLYPVHSEQTRARAEPETRLGLPRAHFPFCTKPRTARTRKPISHVWSFNPTLSLPCSSPLSGDRPAKKQKRKPEAQTGGPQFQRRCSHCQVQKTPQWRAGPLGPKTLCNACGVRFKSGRLFPEYRPACSPTFSGEIHSNSHRKVLEMRRRKETAGPVTGSEQARMVPSF